VGSAELPVGSCQTEKLKVIISPFGGRVFILYYNKVGDYLHVGGFIGDLFLWGVFRVVVDVVAWRFSFEV